MELSNWINDSLYVSQCSCGHRTAYQKKALCRKKEDEEKEYVVGENERRVIAYGIRNPTVSQTAIGERATVR
jgi:hypothetical protein